MANSCAHYDVSYIFSRRYMYWIHWGVTSTNIMSAHMSHGGGELLKIQVFEPRGMAIDYSEQLPYRRVFYADLLLGKGVVKKADFHMVTSNILTAKLKSIH